MSIWVISGRHLTGKLLPALGPGEVVDGVELRGARVVLPGEVCVGVADAVFLQTGFGGDGAVVEGDVVVAHVVEEVDLVLLQEQGCCDGVDGRVTPSLVEEAAGVVQVVEVRSVGLGSPEVQAGDLEVGPEMASVVGLSVVVGDPFQQVVGHDVLLVLLDELLGGVP